MQFIPEPGGNVKFCPVENRMCNLLGLLCIKSSASEEVIIEHCRRENKFVAVTGFICGLGRAMEDDPDLAERLGASPS